MVSSGIRHALRRAVTILAFVVAPVAAAVDASDDELDRILAKIQQIERAEGAYAPALLDELKRMIVLYRENDEHAFALATIERALQVVRANSGLYSLEQVPLLCERIESEEARGNHEEVWDLEQELLTLARRHPADLTAVPVLRRVADRQSAVLERVIAGNEIPPQVVLGCYNQEWPIDANGNCR